MKKYLIEETDDGGGCVEYQMVEHYEGDFILVKELKQYIADNLPNYIKIVEELMRL